ncbi:MAG TPA: hypothetical protein VN848_10070 [Gemmatimonadales bacterium]|nr:hypothetical protein [Gemmatimonadales bacterium]
MTFRQMPRLLVLLLAGSLALGCSQNPINQGPFVSDFNGENAPEGQIGSTVLAEGLNYGTVPDSLVFSSQFGTGIPASVITWLDSYIVGTIPPGSVGGTAYVSTVGGSSAAIVFAINPQDSFPGSFTWRAGTALPVAVSGAGVTYAALEQATSTVRAVYVTGGADNSGNPTSAVYFATIDALGNLSAWKTTTPLPKALAFHGIVAPTTSNSLIQNSLGSLLVMGGTTDRAGTASSAIYQGVLNGDGSVASWTQLGITLPAPLHSFGTAINFDDIYVVGGATTGNAPVSTVYRAVLQNTGQPISWHTEAALPKARSHLGVGFYGLTLYAVGGDSGVATPNDSAGATAVSEVDYAAIDPYLRVLGTGWVVSQQTLPGGRSGLSALGAGAPGAAAVTVTGGLYSGAASGSSEENYLSLSITGSVLSSAAGSASINSLCGCNLFNSGSTGYRDGNRNYHLLVVGGDDVNSPGTKHAQTFLY